MRPKSYMPHAFFATRKGTPKGVAGDWAKRCDICDEGPDAHWHRRASQEQLDQGIVDALGCEKEECEKK